LLRGDGQGGFQAVPGQKSGLLIYGEQRGAAVSDFDADGRPDLVVSQNGNETRLFRNAGARPGLRVRLEGPDANPTGVGARLRLRFGERAGPVRAITAGTGYWSQDSPVPVLATPQEPTALWVRWPGGGETVSDIPPGSREISIRPDGVLKRIR
jgi:hypothetical protein